MEPLKLDDVKARITELPEVTTLQSDHRLMLDSPTLRGGKVGAGPIVARAHTDLPLTPGAPTIQGSVLILDGNQIKRFNLAAAVGSENIWYLGPFPAPPSRTNTGLPLVPGYQYFNTGNKQVYIYVGSGPSEGWQPYGVPYPANSLHYYYQFIADTTDVDGPDEFGQELIFDTTAQDDVQVYINGAKLLYNVDYTLLEDSVVHFGGSVCGGSVCEIVVQKRVDASYAVTPIAVNTDLWVFDGNQRVFPLIKLGGGELVPGSSLNTLLSLNGVLLNPSQDYTVVGAEVFFAVAPVPAATAWMTVGIPIVPDYIPNAITLASQPDTGDLHGTFMDMGDGLIATFE
jgi:hypothetical protein